jgi:hypothetical protein
VAAESRIPTPGLQNSPIAEAALAIAIVAAVTVRSPTLPPILLQLHGGEGRRAGSSEARGHELMSDDTRDTRAYARRHLRFGWWSLLLFLSLGFVLEMLHGFKVGWYLDVSNETRRLMWTLAHAHGSLLSLVHIVFGLMLHRMSDDRARRWRLASACLVGSSILLPGGFLLGGVVIYSGDPGIGILLVPVGALLMFAAVLLAARAAARFGE